MRHIRSTIAAGLDRDVSYDDCLNLAVAGDPVAGPVVADAGLALGKPLAAVTTLTMTSHIVLTGEGVRLAEVAGESIWTGIRQDRHPLAQPVSLTIQPHDPAHWARGAAMTAIQNYVNAGGM
jgi:predicted NBD/HSP70 family sugar kinase